MIGNRVANTAAGFIKLVKPGDYGKVNKTLDEVRGIEKMLWWQLIAPDGSTCSLNPAIHTVTEHSDGTITVSPSIVTSTWHGFLERGVWRQV